MKEVVTHDSSDNALNHFVSEAEKKLSNCKQWMGVVFQIVDGKIELGVRTTYAFPINDCLAAIGLLCENLHREALLLQQKKSPLVGPPPPLPSYDVSKMKPFVNAQVETEGNQFLDKAVSEKPKEEETE